MRVLVSVIILYWFVGSGANWSDRTDGSPGQMGLKQRTSPFRCKSLRRTTSQILKSLSHPGKRATPIPVLMPEMRQMRDNQRLDLSPCRSREGMANFVYIHMVRNSQEDRVRVDTRAPAYRFK